MKATPRPYHHGHLREALLGAAETALETGGIRSINLRELSRELGVSHGSPRRHFANKQALLAALALRGFERLEGVLGSAAREDGQCFQTRLIELARAYVGFALKHPALLNLMYEAKSRSDAPHELLEASERALAHGPATFAEAQATGEVVPGDLAPMGLLVVSALLGLVSISTNGLFKGVPINHLVDGMVERMIQGFRPR